MSPVTDRTLAALCFAIFAFALLAGYVWGRWNGQRALDDVYDQGYDAALVEMDGREWLAVMPLDSGRDDTRSVEPAPLVTGPPGDWRDRTMTELAPEALGAPEVPRPDLKVHAGLATAGPGDDPLTWYEQQQLDIIRWRHETQAESEAFLRGEIDLPMSARMEVALIAESLVMA